MNNNVNMNLYMTNTTDWIALREKIATIEEEKKEMTKEMDDLKEINENMLNMLTKKELENEQLLKQV